MKPPNTPPEDSHLPAEAPLPEEVQELLRPMAQPRSRLLPDERALEDLPARVENATQLLESVAEDRGILAYLSVTTRERLLKAAGIVSRPGRAERKRLAKAERRKRLEDRRASDNARLSETGIRAKRREQVYQTPFYRPSLPLSALEAEEEWTTVEGERRCYVCKVRYRRIHHFYDSLCPQCAPLNYEKRQLTADLSGRVALVTGGRVKIGYQAVVKLLRAGCHTVVTTRFPRDAAERFSREEDFERWGDRLEIHGLDLRHTPSVEAFTRYMRQAHDRLDFIVNNACQTVRRPPGFYDHLMGEEGKPLDQLPEETRQLIGAYEALRQSTLSSVSDDGDSTVPAVMDRDEARGIVHAADLSQLALVAEDLNKGPHLFPRGLLDQDLQQIDLRERNSWRLGLDEVPAVELLEVHLVNAVAPFILNSRLKGLMTRVPGNDKHIVNVSAMEGQFYRAFKTDKHPHTNMAKAALNMMTRTSAMDYVKDGIHMNSVDTGWITDEDPIAVARRKTAEHGFHPPLDIVDGAARILDPIFDGFNTGEHVWGQFLKDYKPTDW